MLKTEKGGDSSTAGLRLTCLCQMRKSRVDNVECFVQQIRNGLVGLSDDGVEEVLQISRAKRD